ncbi:MAG TPA: transglycosylase SLT domain-containing protein [Ktedonobacteraceae bacterium]|nr:transglycosylase SLT domain-containing protein [Ktedonobacteraceae bacterium]
MTVALPNYLPDRSRLRATPMRFSGGFVRCLRMFLKKFLLVLLSTLLLCASIAITILPTGFLAAQNRRACTWYTVEAGDTLTAIAMHYHTTIFTLAHTNDIRDVNLIFVNQRLCIPSRWRSGPSGITAEGTVRWYAYNALGWSSRPQVHRLLYHVAAVHHLPARLLMAIAWQESNWTQHVIAWDGGIGVMQLMPYTAMEINADTGQQLDPYDLQDNLNLGATYLEWLWRAFHGDLVKVISAYNEGGWAVEHYGIYNWQYVDNVLALMRELN